MRYISFLLLSTIFQFLICGCSNNGDFKATLFETSREEVKSISIQSDVDGEAIVLFMENNQWFASNQRVSVPVPDKKMQSVFQKISHLKAAAILNHPEESGIRFPAAPFHLIQIEKKDGTTYSFQVLEQKKDSMAYMKFPATEEVYLLSKNSKKVAKLPGFSLADFRDRTFTIFKAEEVIEVRFEAGDSLVASLKQDSTGDWVSGDALLVNREGMDSFLGELAELSGETFDDSFDPVTDAIDQEAYKLSLIVANSIDPIEILCYRYADGDLPYILQSSQNEGSFFASGKSGLYAKTIGRIRLLTGF